jgi:predicted lipoprotein
VADRRLGRPLGTFDKPRPDLAEARASGRSLRNVTLSLQALSGLAQTLCPDSPRSLAALDRAIALAQDLEDLVFDGISDPQGRLRVEILQQAVRAARDAAVAEIGPSPGVSVGFNAQDGD